MKKIIFLLILLPILILTCGQNNSLVTDVDGFDFVYFHFSFPETPQIDFSFRYANIISFEAGQTQEKQHYREEQAEENGYYEAVCTCHHPFEIGEWNVDEKDKKHDRGQYQMYTSPVSPPGEMKIGRFPFITRIRKRRLLEDVPFHCS